MGWCGDPIAAPQIAPLSSRAPNCIARSDSASTAVAQAAARSFGSSRTCASPARGVTSFFRSSLHYSSTALSAVARLGSLVAPVLASDMSSRAI